MSPRRLQEEATYVADDATPSVYRDGISNPSLLPRPGVRPVRNLSMDAVMEDLRAILWPERCDPLSADGDPVRTIQMHD